MKRRRRRRINNITAYLEGAQWFIRTLKKKQCKFLDCDFKKSMSGSIVSSFDVIHCFFNLLPSNLQIVQKCGSNM
jgi:hypothetical protein